MRAETCAAACWSRRSEGGGSVLGHALADWPEPPPVAAVNTDARALAGTGIALKVMIGRTVAKGMGTGGDAELGRLAANEDLDALRALVTDYDLLVLVASLGGEPPPAWRRYWRGSPGRKDR